MSRTDKDRPLEIKADDPSDARWYVAHRHFVIGPDNALLTTPCDYKLGASVEFYRQRFNIPRQSWFDPRCEGRLRRRRNDDSTPKYWRKHFERRARRQTSQLLGKIRSGALDEFEVM